MINWKLEIGNWKFVLLLFVICFLLFAATPVLAGLEECKAQCDLSKCGEPGGLMKEVPKECACCGCCELNDILKIGVGISKLILRWVGVLALIFFIVGGIMWMASGGNPERVKKGKSILVNTIIGLLIVFLSWQIVNIVICGLSQGKLQETCEIFGNEKWNIFPGEKEKIACKVNEDGSPKEPWSEGCFHPVISGVKKLLNELECNCGDETEIFDAQMTTCVKIFQKANSLSETGQIDVNTWKKMIVEPGEPLPNKCT